jgi:hypothetical protein
MRVEKLVCAAALAVVCVSFVAEARVQPHALGLRFIGSGILLGGEINYQKAMGLFGSDRLEIGASFSGGDYWSDVGGTAVTQWHWNINPVVAKGGFNWYVGPGVGAGFHIERERWIRVKEDDVWVDRLEKGSSRMSVRIGGQIGVEYDFNAVGAPINLSIDSRPMIDLLYGGGPTLGDILFGANLAIRYTF